MKLDVTPGMNTGSGGAGDTTSKIVSGLAIALFLGLFFLSLFQLYQQSDTHTDAIISADIAALGAIFEQINSDCIIAGFEHDRNYIDFLTVTSFAGVQVGGMKLVNPSNWKGPYLTGHPLMQDMMYEIVKAQDGYYIVPGNRVVLHNGLVMGKDVIITPETTVEPMLQPGGKLVQGHKKFAYKLPVQKAGLMQMLSYLDR